MPPLDNPRQEKFCQLRAQGATLDAAYVGAGYKANAQNAHRLTKKDEIEQRITEILRQVGEKHEITIARVLEEYARIAFADIGNVVEYRGQTVVLKDVDSLTPSQRACIAGISEMGHGGVQVKLHSKTTALDALAKHLGIFSDAHHINVEVNTIEHKAPPRAQTMAELAEMIQAEEIRARLAEHVEEGE